MVEKLLKWKEINVDKKRMDSLAIDERYQDQYAINFWLY